MMSVYWLTRAPPPFGAMPWRRVKKVPRENSATWALPPLMVASVKVTWGMVSGGANPATRAAPPLEILLKFR